MLKEICKVVKRNMQSNFEKNVKVTLKKV